MSTLMREVGGAGLCGAPASLDAVFAGALPTALAITADDATGEDAAVRSRPAWALKLLLLDPWLPRRPVPWGFR
jgi:hypothetical protein